MRSSGVLSSTFDLDEEVDAFLLLTGAPSSRLGFCKMLFVDRLVVSLVPFPSFTKYDQHEVQ
jgi:hypothetical protein